MKRGVACCQSCAAGSRPGACNPCSRPPIGSRVSICMGPWNRRRARASFWSCLHSTAASFNSSWSSWPPPLLPTSISSSSIMAPFTRLTPCACPPMSVSLFLPPYAPELNPIERLWRDLKDWLAPRQPPTLDALSTLLTTRLRYYSPRAGPLPDWLPLLRRGCPPR